MRGTRRAYQPQPARGRKRGQLGQTVRGTSGLLLLVSESVPPLQKRNGIQTVALLTYSGCVGDTKLSCVLLRSCLLPLLLHRDKAGPVPDGHDGRPRFHPSHWEPCVGDSFCGNVKILVLLHARKWTQPEIVCVEAKMHKTWKSRELIGKPNALLTFQSPTCGFQ